MPLPIAMGWTSQLPDSDAESTKNGSLVARFEPGENPVAEYYYFDGLGSTVMMTQGLSTITDRYDYDAWGNEYPIMVSTADNPYRYVGQLGYYTHWMDSSLTDLLHLGVRFYEPGVGRFGQVDPAGEGWNWFIYVDSQPTVDVDPAGLFSLKKSVCRLLFGQCYQCDLRAQAAASTALNYWYTRGYRRPRRVNGSSDEFNAVGHCVRACIMNYMCHAECAPQGGVTYYLNGWYEFPGHLGWKRKETEMDICNNDIGLTLGLGVNDAKTCAKRCLDKMLSGELCVLTPVPRTRR